MLPMRRWPWRLLPDAVAGILEMQQELMASACNVAGCG